MADEDMIDGSSRVSDTGSSEDESDDEPVELLVTGRERRKTAGNRYDRDMVLEEVADEEEPDEVALLFAGDDEAEDDEFKSEEPDDDAEMSSEDDDDQGPNAAADDLEGEKEIQKQAKAERARKRKADLALTTVAGIRKKPKIDPTQMQKLSPVKKPSKKKERVTWLPTQDTSAGRSSLRKQTIAHRAITIARLKQSEAQSKKMRALKEVRDRERAKDAPKEMTQADRLAEAARVERRNAKSLNRWEAMEKKRVEEQAAKLAALKNRKLEGPVVTLWSAKAKWIGPRLNKLGSKDTTGIVEGGTEAKKRGRKSKAYHEQMAAEKEAAESSQASNSQVVEGNTQSTSSLPTLDKGDILEVKKPSEHPPITSAASQGPDNFLQGIHEFATMPPEAVEAPTNTTSASAAAVELGKPPDAEPRPDESSTTQAPSVEPDTQPKEAPAQTPVTESENQGAPLEVQQGDSSQIENKEVVSQVQQPSATSIEAEAGSLHELPKEQTPEPLVEEFSTRNLVVLEKFDQLSSHARQEYSLFYNNRRTGRPVKHTNELCPITTLPVKYRDPATGIGFGDMNAYKKLHELKDHKFTWSSMLGCYVGRMGGSVARGVPEGFLGPSR